MTKPMSWPLAVLIAIDQLGNAIAGGNPDATISSRSYYFAHVQANMLKYYWNLLVWIIDTTFAPIHGPGHCKHAYEGETDEAYYPGSDITRAILGLLVITVCIPLSVLLRFAVLFVPAWRYQPA